jgi:cholesterol transport system auxiliary component
VRRIAVSAAILAVLAGCSSPPPPTFDLTAPGATTRLRPVARQLVIPEPNAVQALDSDRILVRGADGSLSTLAGAQWADRLPRLVQARLVQTFENAGRVAAVGRPGDRITPDLLLSTEIRRFQIEAGPREAVVEISAKLIEDRTGRVLGGRVISARRPVEAMSGAEAARALDAALAEVLIETLRWSPIGR